MQILMLFQMGIVIYLGKICIKIIHKKMNFDASSQILKVSRMYSLVRTEALSVREEVCTRGWILSMLRNEMQPLCPTTVALFCTEKHFLTLKKNRPAPRAVKGLQRDSPEGWTQHG